MMCCYGFTIVDICMVLKGNEIDYAVALNLL
jgi:hypothetical protein